MIDAVAHVVVTGLGDAVLDAGSEAVCNARSYLKTRKTRKYMGQQDHLAVVAAGRSLEAAALSGNELGERAGLYLSVGYIPFEQTDIDRLYVGSLVDGEFDPAAFSVDGFESIRPTLTFRCLPNMPAFHVSCNFDVQGPYFVTYPGVGQLYLALERALCDLQDGLVDVALVGGVAHQRNFLVTHHFSRCSHPISSDRLADAAGFVVLETEERAAARAAKPRLKLAELSIQYTPFDPFEPGATHVESVRIPPESRLTSARDHGKIGAASSLSVKKSASRVSPGEGELGPASLFVELNRMGDDAPGLVHRVTTRDGIRACSKWERL